jgi:hypothetical protein
MKRITCSGTPHEVWNDFRSNVNKRPVHSQHRADRLPTRLRSPTTNIQMHRLLRRPVPGISQKELARSARTGHDLRAHYPQELARISRRNGRWVAETSTTRSKSHQQQPPEPKANTFQASPSAPASPSPTSSPSTCAPKSPSASQSATAALPSPGEPTIQASSPKTGTGCPPRNKT